MAAKKNQTLQNGSAKVGAGRGRERRAEVCRGRQVARTSSAFESHLTLSHVSPRYLYMDLYLQ